MLSSVGLIWPKVANINWLRYGLVLDFSCIRTAQYQFHNGLCVFEADRDIFSAFYEQEGVQRWECGSQTLLFQSPNCCSILLNDQGTPFFMSPHGEGVPFHPSRGDMKSGGPPGRGGGGYMVCINVFYPRDIITFLSCRFCQVMIELIVVGVG